MVRRSMAAMPMALFSAGPLWGIASPIADSGEERMTRLGTAALFAIAMSVLTFAASVAEVPRSAYEPLETMAP